MVIARTVQHYFSPVETVRWREDRPFYHNVQCLVYAVVHIYMIVGGRSSVSIQFAQNHTDGYLSL